MQIIKQDNKNGKILSDSKKAYNHCLKGHNVDLARSAKGRMFSSVTISLVLMSSSARVSKVLTTSC